MIMFAFPSTFLLFSAIIYISHEESDEIKTRDFFSSQLKGEDINSKLTHIDFFDPRGVIDFLKKTVKECRIITWDGKHVETCYIFQQADFMFAPNISWYHEEGHYYTLFLGDLDDKEVNGTKVQFQPYCKWLVSNIRGCNVKNGTQIFAYASPKRAPPTEIRRYIVLIYDQHYDQPIDFSSKGYFEVDEKGHFLHQESSTERTDFRIDKFAEWHHFDHPIAANLYMIADQL